MTLLFFGFVFDAAAAASRNSSSEEVSDSGTVLFGLAVGAGATAGSPAGGRYLTWVRYRMSEGWRISREMYLDEDATAKCVR